MARSTSRTVRLGAKPDANSMNEYNRTSTIKVGRRPQRSAARPNKYAPTGRIANVSKMANVTSVIWVLNFCLVPSHSVCPEFASGKQLEAQLTAHNRVGDSVQDLLVYLDREGVLNKKGKLFILAIGVDKYPKFDAIHWLHYAAADARLMLDTLTKQAGPLHTEVIPKLLVTDGETPPTKANIEDALLFFHEADDTVILFLAGHGENEGADYLFMPQDAEEVDKKYFRPSTVVKWSV
jgi:hypothetical protein